MTQNYADEERRGEAGEMGWMGLELYPQNTQSNAEQEQGGEAGERGWSG